MRKNNAERSTHNIANMGFSGMQKFVARFNFLVTRQEITRKRQLIIPPSLMIRLKDENH